MTYLRPDLEKERRENRLSPVAPNTALTRVARLHSDDMLRRGCFSHYTQKAKRASTGYGSIKYVFNPVAKTWPWH